MYINRDPGTGTQTPKVGDTVVAQYSGRLLDGTPFDSSFVHGGPFTFQVGLGQVIKGWDEAFLDDEEGRAAHPHHPYWLGYGEAGRPPRSLPARRSCSTWSWSTSTRGTTRGSA